MHSASSSSAPLSRDSISRAALAILDDYGLADVTMRRVASALGVAPAALYWHVKNKQDLISAVAARIVGPLLSAPEPESPANLCETLRATLLSHRDGAEVVISAMSQTGSTVSADLTDLMRAALTRHVHGAAGWASSSDVHAVADGLLYMTVGAATVQQSAAQLAEATGAAGAESRPADVSTAIALLIDALSNRGT